MDVKAIAIGLLVFISILTPGSCTNYDFIRSPSMPIIYSSRELRELWKVSGPTSEPILDCTPKEIKRRKRGRSGGVKKRLKRRTFKPFIPSIIMGNVQSLNNKMDELHGHVKYQNEFRNISLMSFTETWLTDYDLDGMVSIDGFKLMRGDRICEDVHKGKGGGVCVYVNERWCHPNNASIKKHMCSSHCEILITSLRPFYLPREFSNVIHFTIYVPNINMARPAANEILKEILFFK